MEENQYDIQVERPVERSVEEVVVKKKREMTTRQKEALAKARLVRAMNKKKEQNKTIEEDNNLPFSMNYLMLTGGLASAGLVLYFLLKQPTNSAGSQPNLMEQQIQDLKKLIANTMAQREIVMVPQAIEAKKETKQQETKQIKDERIEQMFGRTI